MGQVIWCRSMGQYQTMLVAARRVVLLLLVGGWLGLAGCALELGSASQGGEQAMSAELPSLVIADPALED